MSTHVTLHLSFSISLIVLLYCQSLLNEIIIIGTANNHFEKLKQVTKITYFIPVL